MKAALAFAHLGLLLAAGLALNAACGSDSNPATATRAASPQAAASTTPGAFGPGPQLGENITAVSPAHAAQIKQALTVTKDPLQPAGVCFEANFKNTPQYGLWFRMAIDGKEVTTKLSWIVPTRDAPTKGTACYSPDGGFAVGRHNAAVSVQDPGNPNAPALQAIGWEFDVIP